MADAGDPVKCFGFAAGKLYHDLVCEAHFTEEERRATEIRTGVLVLQMQGKLPSFSEGEWS